MTPQPLQSLLGLHSFGRGTLGRSVSRMVATGRVFRTPGTFQNLEPEGTAFLRSWNHGSIKKRLSSMVVLEILLLVVYSVRVCPIRHGRRIYSSAVFKA